MLQETIRSVLLSGLLFSTSGFAAEPDHKGLTELPPDAGFTIHFTRTVCDKGGYPAASIGIRWPEEGRLRALNPIVRTKKALIDIFNSVPLNLQYLELPNSETIDQVWDEAQRAINSNHRCLIKMA